MYRRSGSAIFQSMKTYTVVSTGFQFEVRQIQSPAGVSRAMGKFPTRQKAKSYAASQRKKDVSAASMRLEGTPV